MILIIIALLLAFLTGCIVSSFFLGNSVRKIEILPISLVIGLIIMSYAVLAASLISGSLEFGVYLFLAIEAFYCIYFMHKNFNSVKEILDLKKYSLKFIFDGLKKISWMEIIFILLFILLFLDVFSGTFAFQDGSYKVSFAGYGDIPYHMTQVSHFIYNKPFNLEDPVYAGSPLKYSFLINLISSSFYVLSHNYAFSFTLPALIFNLSGILLIYSLIARIIRKISARICAFAIFFLGSGINFLKIFQDKLFWEKNSLGEMADYMLHLPYPIFNNNAVYPVQNNIWWNFLTSALMHQRSFFFGFAAGVLSLFVAYLAYLHKEKKYFYLLGLLAGLLPLIHIHTFIAIFLILAAFWVSAKIIKEKEMIRGFFASLLISFIIALPSLYFFTFYKKSGASFLAFRLGWMTEPGIGSVQYNPAWKIHIWEWISFVWQNFGIFLPMVLVIAAIFIFKRSPFKGDFKNKYLVLALIVSSLFLWTTINLVRFQPWDVDNNKIFAYLMFTGAIIIGYYFDQLKFYGSRLLMIILAFFIILTGVIDVFQRSSLADPPLYEIFSPQDQAVADWIVKNTDSDDVILTGGSHLNPVNSLAGRPVLMGYDGWLWSHGIDYSEREADIRKIYTGSKESNALIKKYNIEYIVLGAKERYDYKTDGAFLNSKYPIAFQLDNTKIYRIADK